MNSNQPKAFALKTRSWIPLVITSLLALQAAAFAGADDARYQYAEMLRLTREVLTRKSARDFLNEVFKAELQVDPIEAQKMGFRGTEIKSLSEAQFLLLLQENPDLWSLVREYLAAVPKDQQPAKGPLTPLTKEWREKFRGLLKNASVVERFRKQNNPLESFLLEQPDGIPGYSQVQMYVNHPWLRNGKPQKAEDLKKVWIDFILSAQKEIILNVFDFDLKDVADALIRQKQRGLFVRVGIDLGVIKARPQVKEIFEQLQAGGVDVHGVDSVGLNHQKLIAIDWSDDRNARVLMSSGNATQSCIGKEGDLVGTRVDSPFSIPNANHVITVKSHPLALVIHHELTKTLDPQFRLRGSQYPLGGSYRILGEKLKSQMDPRSLVIAFTPNGGLDSINTNFIGRAIRTTTGPIRMAQFAFSSKEVLDALKNRARLDLAAGRKFDFRSSGDGPFAMQDWSIFLEMSGLRLDRSRKPPYGHIPEKPWELILGKQGAANLRSNIKIAPYIFGNHRVEVQGSYKEVSSKIHHKLMTLGSRTTVTGSFNFSNGAENNQEYIVEFSDELVTAKALGIIEWLYNNGKSTVYDEAMRRNNKGRVDAPVDSDVDNPEALKDRGPSSSDRIWKITPKKKIKTVPALPKKSAA